MYKQRSIFADIAGFFIIGTRVSYAKLGIALLAFLSHATPNFNFNSVYVSHGMALLVMCPALFERNTKPQVSRVSTIITTSHTNRSTTTNLAAGDDQSGVRYFGKKSRHIFAL